MIGLSLTCALALSSCASTGKGVRPECPKPDKLPPVDSALMKEPTFEQSLRDELFGPAPSVTPR
jgi:hypothetical protein